MQVLNFGILKNPINWLTVLMMLVIFGIAADVVLRHFSHAAILNASQSLNEE